MNRRRVSIMQYDKVDYPFDPPFNPSTNFPEYSWGDELSFNGNKIYEMVRELLFSLDMDAVNFGKPEWNPLKHIIQPGNTVLIKPNLVYHINKGPGNETPFSVITHPSVVRAVGDYAVKALGGYGKLVIGDAPLQTCHFDDIKGYGYDKIVKFYLEKGIDCELADFRLMISEKSDNVISKVEKRESLKHQYLEVDLGQNSALIDIADRHMDYRVTNYDPAVMQEHHNNIKNEYIVSRKVLDADVIINIPKPKTHRKAGFTCSMKNFVGINGNKDWLPHHRRGDKSNAGDEYLNKCKIKEIQINLQEMVDSLAIGGNYMAAKVVHFGSKPFKYIRKFTQKDKYMEGSWWGNDTIWRTIQDLCSIALYANRDGAICSEKQREIFIVGDMIITGEKEGPLEPSAKNFGALVAGHDLLLFDAVVASIMGFDYHYIPSIAESGKKTRNPFDYCIQDVEIVGNTSSANKNIDDIMVEDRYKHIPSSGWIGHIEKIKMTTKNHPPSLDWPAQHP